MMPSTVETSEDTLPLRDPWKGSPEHWERLDRKPLRQNHTSVPTELHFNDLTRKESARFVDSLPMCGGDYSVSKCNKQ